MEGITDADYPQIQKEFAKSSKQWISENIMICMFKEFHCHCKMMYFRNLDICVLVYPNLLLQN